MSKLHSSDPNGAANRTHRSRWPLRADRAPPRRHLGAWTGSAGRRRRSRPRSGHPDLAGDGCDERRYSAATGARTEARRGKHDVHAPEGYLMRMAKRWMAFLILAGACEGQPAPRTAASANAQVAQAPWWCVDAADGFSSNCERALSDCESMNRRPRRRAGPCSPEPAAHCFRYVNKGLTING